MKDIKIVIGANWGDEGKGLMTDYFSQKPNSMVVRKEDIQLLHQMKSDMSFIILVQGLSIKQVHIYQRILFAIRLFSDKNIMN